VSFDSTFTERSNALPAPRPTGVRHRVIFVLTMMSLLLYLDRFCISFAEIYIKEDLGLSDRQIAWMFSAFFWTYAIGQVPSGWLGDRFGSRAMLTIYILTWSVFTGWIGAAGAFLAIMLLRLGFGFAQAGAYPTGASLVSRWAPLANRGLASSLVAVGGRFGGAIAPLLTAYLIVLYVPLSTPSTLKPSDILDAPRLAYEMVHGSYSSKPPQRTDRNSLGAIAGERMLEEMSPSMRAEFEAAALEFADSEALRIGGQTTLPESSNRRTAFAEEFNRLLGGKTLLSLEEAKGVKWPSESKRLLAKPAGSLSSSEQTRLNRLILEALYPGAVRKVYGAGWRPVMWTFAAVGIVVAAFTWWIVRNRPREHPRVNEAEEKLIARGRPPDSGPRPVGRAPMREIFTSRSMWLNSLMQFATNIGWVFIVTWLPRYLDEVHRVPIEMKGWMTFLPTAVGMTGVLLGGKLTDAMVRWAGPRWGRSIPMGLTRFLGVGAYIFCLFEPSPWAAVAAFSLVAFSTDLGVSATWAFAQDVGGRHVGSVLGWGNMWGNLGAAAAPLILQGLVERYQNWNAAFLVCAGAFLVAGAAGLMIDATKPVVREEQASEDRSP
jgi:ACS family glucarate transporter-like MFS transporter